MLATVPSRVITEWLALYKIRDEDREAEEMANEAIANDLTAQGNRR